MRARLGQTVAYGHHTALQIKVKVGQVGAYYQFSAEIYIDPEGKTLRMARAGEVELRVQSKRAFILIDWQTLAMNTTDATGSSFVMVKLTDMLVGDTIRLAARHIGSNAEVGKEYSIQPDWSLVVTKSEYVIKEGSEMPADFEQPRMAQPSTHLPSRIPNIAWAPGRGFHRRQ